LKLRSRLRQCLQRDGTGQPGRLVERHAISGHPDNL
jgi:hypothetical protein